MNQQAAMQRRLYKRAIEWLASYSESSGRGLGNINSLVDLINAVFGTDKQVIARDLKRIKSGVGDSSERRVA